MRLRSGVALVYEEGGWALRDHAGELSVSVGAEAAALLRVLDGPPGALRELARQQFPESPPEEILAELSDTLESVGFLEGNAPPSAERLDALRAAARDAERAVELLAALRFARARVPLFRERLQHLELDSEQLSLADVESQLARAPVTYRTDLRAGFPDRVVADDIDVATLVASGELLLNSTSGTTDERVQVLSSPNPGAITPEVAALMGIERPLRRGAVLTTPLCSGTACHLGDSSIEERTQGVTTYLTSSSDLMAMTDADVRRIVGELAATRPDVLFVHPWYAVHVALRARELGLVIPQVPLILTSFQYPTRRHRRLMSELYGAAVRSHYSATECGGYLMADECVNGSLHVREDHVRLDVLAIRGSAVSGLGHVLVTSIANRVMPLVRYAVGDLVSDGAPCDCGWGRRWRTIVVEGRAKDVVFACDGTAVTPRQVDDAVGDRDVDFYQLVQLRDRAFRLDVMAADGGDLEAVVMRLRAILGAGAEIDTRKVARFSPERSLKFRQTLVAGKISASLPAVAADGAVGRAPVHADPGPPP